MTFWPYSYFADHIVTHDSLFSNSFCIDKLHFTFIVLFFLNNCSFNENSRIWKDKENKLETDKKITKVFAEENISVSEFNRDLKLDLSSIKINNKKNYNQNNQAKYSKGYQYLAIDE